MKRLKKKILAVLGVGVLCMTSIPILAAEANISVQVNGKKVAFSGQKPKVISGTTYVPLRGVFEELGYEVWWIPSSKYIMITKDGLGVTLTQDSRYIMNGEQKALQSKILTLNGSTMLPLREVSTLVGAKVDWNSKTNTVVITYNTSAQSQVDNQNIDNFSNDDVMNNPATHKAQAIYRYIEIIGKRKKEISALSDKYNIVNHYSQVAESDRPNYLKEYKEINNAYIDEIKAIEAGEDFNDVKEKTVNVINQYNEVMKMLLIDKVEDFPKAMEQVPHLELKKAIITYCEKNGLEAKTFFKDINQIYGDTTIIWIY